MSDLFGWDLIYAVSENDIRKKEDVLTLVIHYVLIRNGYRCIGLGDSRELTGNEPSSEVLPKGWNAGSSYSIRYVHDNSLYVLRGVPVAENIVFNLLKGNDLNVSNVAFNAQNTVKSLKGPVTSLLEDYRQVIDKVRTELLEPHKDTLNNKEATTQTNKQSTSVGTSQSTPTLPAHIPTPINPGRIIGQPAVDPFWVDPERDPLRVGRSDLDPFSRGGGMIFNPLDPRSGGFMDPGAGIPGGLPRGAVPPGARFDPFGPPRGRPDQRPRPPPDADHFQPPGFDGMFM
ncbi:proteasome inhibitor PI31 subunit [Cimex lectularius]|uniref:Proteasome inhibitor PI31 subunit n=1 Tax=Cimex lectularius TaxID=79782 RepID=A0A8I6TFB6_CIMLE|nr:proteasome inhibitor PI31 subunit [Cimex lectularius]